MSSTPGSKNRPAQVNRPRGRRGRVAALFFAAGATVCVLLVRPAELAGQDPTLDTIEALVREGDAREARSLIDAWWDGAGPEAPAAEVQRGLWLRGRLTLDPAAAAADYRRLVADYPGGPYSDQARLRLALAAEAEKDLERAREHYRALATDYPSLQSGRDAEAWLAVHGDAAGPVAAPVAEAVTTEDAALPDPSENPSPPAPGERAAVADDRDRDRAATGPFTVQIGAYLSEARASRMTQRVTESGFGARIVKVPGSPLFRVRVGRFDSAAAAAPVADAIATAGFATFITDNALTERPYR